MHVHAEESCGNRLQGQGILFGWFWFISFSSPSSPGEKEITISAKTFQTLIFFCMYFTYMKTIPHNKLKIVGQVNFLLLIFFFVRQKDIISVL